AGVAGVDHEGQGVPRLSLGGRDAQIFALGDGGRVGGEVAPDQHGDGGAAGRDVDALRRDLPLLNGRHVRGAVEDRHVEDLGVCGSTQEASTSKATFARNPTMTTVSPGWPPAYTTQVTVGQPRTCAASRSGSPGRGAARHGWWPCVSRPRTGAVTTTRRKAAPG